MGLIHVSKLKWLGREGLVLLRVIVVYFVVGFGISLKVF